MTVTIALILLLIMTMTTKPKTTITMIMKITSIMKTNKENFSNGSSQNICIIALCQFYF